MNSKKKKGIQEVNSLLKLKVRCIPNAAKTAIVGKIDGSIKFKIHAPPEEGRANDELIEYLAKVFKIPKRSVVLVSGQTSRMKGIILDCGTCEIKSAIQKQIEKF